MKKRHQHSKRNSQEANILSIAVLLLITVSLPLLSQGQLSPEQITLNDRLLEAYNDCTPSNVFRQFPSNTMTMPIPAMGLNGKITYGQGAPTSSFDYSSQDLRDAIGYMGLDHLRFPGGTFGNSFNLYSTRLDISGSDLFRVHFIEQGAVIPLSSADDRTWVQVEGSSLQLDGYMKEMDLQVIPTGLSLFLDESSSMYSVNGGGYQIYENASFNEMDPNYLKDFISLTEELGIEPVFMLRVFDPLYFILPDKDAETSANDYSYVRLSPALIQDLGTVIGNPADEDFYCNNHAAIRNLLLESSDLEVKRQLVKYVYEYLHYHGENPDVGDFNAYLNNVGSNDLIYNWSAFTAAYSGHGTLSPLPLRFELGNELWLKWMFKFLPPDVNTASPTCDDLLFNVQNNGDISRPTNATLYGEMCLHGHRSHFPIC